MYDEKAKDFQQARQAVAGAVNAKSAYASGAGAPPSAMAGDYRPSIRQRAERTIAEFQMSARRAEAAHRARAIIDAHPEFAELLDLIHEF